MKRILLFSLCTTLTAATLLAQATKSSARRELVPAPLRSTSAPPFAAHPSAYNFPRYEYPRIEADSRVTFQLKAPDAKKVQVWIAGVQFDPSGCGCVLIRMRADQIVRASIARSHNMDYSREGFP